MLQYVYLNYLGHGQVCQFKSTFLYNCFTLKRFFPDIQCPCVQATERWSLQLILPIVIMKIA